METIKASDARQRWSELVTSVGIHRRHFGIERTSAVQAVLVDPAFYDRACELMQRETEDGVRVA